jgi:hypothetical protein
MTIQGLEFVMVQLLFRPVITRNRPIFPRAVEETTFGLINITSEAGAMFKRERCNGPAKIVARVLKSRKLASEIFAGKKTQKIERQTNHCQGKEKIFLAPALPKVSELGSILRRIRQHKLLFGAALAQSLASAMPVDGTTKKTAIYLMKPNLLSSKTLYISGLRR